MGVVDGLSIGTSYLVDIQAVNDVGIGDSCQLEIATAEIEEVDAGLHETVENPEHAFDTQPNWHGDDPWSPCRREAAVMREAPSSHFPDSLSLVEGVAFGARAPLWEL